MVATRSSATTRHLSHVARGEDASALPNGPHPCDGQNQEATLSMHMQTNTTRALCRALVAALLATLAVACGDESVNDAQIDGDAGVECGDEACLDPDDDGASDSDASDPDRGPVTEVPSPFPPPLPYPGDSDGDGIPDSIEGTDDADGDGVPNYLDLDSDGDGIPDAIEGYEDADGDGIPNFLDLDSDGDGIPDAIEGYEDADGDGIPNFLDLDSDGDGIPDAIEGYEDADGDGIPNFLDLDSDGDGIPDAIEGYGDADGDGIPNFLDLDSDGDGIPDRYEGYGDADGDGIPNFLDLDSDGDGWLDAEEYGQIPGSGLPPIDTDRDGVPDFLDVDSDGDGLPDEIELGCPESTERLLWDSDGDGLSDLVEVVFAYGPEDEGQACDPERGIYNNVDFYFELEFRGPPDSDELEFSTDVRRADVVFNVDTTGSMGGVINSLRASMNTIIIPGLAAGFDDVGYAVSQFDDFPCNGHGSGADRPLRLRQRVTTSATSAQAGVNAMTLHFGADLPESGFESLYQLATGVGRSNRSLCLSSQAPESWIVPPFDAAIGYIPGIADGTIGGAGFREGSVPIIIHVTDAPSHAKGEPANRPYAYGATRLETYQSLAAIGAKIIGVASSESGRPDLEEMSFRSGSTVPACAWDDFRPPGCAVGQCCTGQEGGGRAPSVGGVCPLVYDIRSFGDGLDESVLAGVQALVNFATFDLTTRVRGDEDTLNDTGIDTSCFIESVVPLRYEFGDRTCVSEPEIADFRGTGVPDGFAGVTPGTQLFFQVNARNNCVEPTTRPQVFVAYIDIVEPLGAAVLDTQIVTVLVPPDVKL